MFGRDNTNNFNNVYNSFMEEEGYLWQKQQAKDMLHHIRADCIGAHNRAVRKRLHKLHLRADWANKPIDKKSINLSAHRVWDRIYKASYDAVLCGV